MSLQVHAVTSHRSHKKNTNNFFSTRGTCLASDPGILTPLLAGSRTDPELWWHIGSVIHGEPGDLWSLVTGSIIWEGWGHICGGPDVYVCLHFITSCLEQIPRLGYILKQHAPTGDTIPRKQFK